MKLSWIDDLKAESDFRSMNIAFTKKAIRFSKIDLKESQYNGARLGDPIVPDLIRDYKEGMKNGDSFPRPVVYLAKSGYILTSGNQRCNAIKELIAEGAIDGDPTIEVYVLETSDKMLLEAAARAANVGHGGRATWDERLAHAMYMVRVFGFRAEDAAKLFMVASSTIVGAIRAEEMRGNLEKKGIDASSIPRSTLDVISQVKYDDGLVTKIGTLAAQHKPSTERIKQLVGAAKKAKSEDGRMQLVKGFEKELAQAEHRYRTDKPKAATNGRKTPKRPRRDAVIGLMTRLANFLDFQRDGEGFASLDQLQIACKEDEDSLRDLWKRLQFRFGVILGKRK